MGVNASVTWNEHIFFEPRGLTQSQVEDAKIEIRILDKRFFKDSLVGLYVFDVPQIYFHPSHAIFHQWVALSNPKSNKFNEITGYLKLSVSVIGPGDEQVALNEDTRIDKTENHFIMKPPHIETRYFQLKIRIFKGEKLPDMDTFGTIDAFIS